MNLLNPPLPYKTLTVIKAAVISQSSSSPSSSASGSSYSGSSYSGDEWFLDGLDRHVHTAAKVIKIVSAAAACFVIGMFSYYMIVLQSQATVYLDVNPSIQFELNSREEVISAEAANQDGEIILEDMDLKHTDLDVAVNAIFGSKSGREYGSAFCRQQQSK